MAAAKAKASAKAAKGDEADETGPAIALDDALVAAMVDASAGLDDLGDAAATVAITIGKKQKVVLDISGGRVVGAGDEDQVAVTVPTTGAQLVALVEGTESVARAYMQGDLKPVGATGAFLPFVELFENAEFRSSLAAALGR